MAYIVELEGPDGVELDLLELVHILGVDGDLGDVLRDGLTVRKAGERERERGRVGARAKEKEGDVSWVNSAVNSAWVHSHCGVGVGVRVGGWGWG